MSLTAVAAFAVLAAAQTPMPAAGPLDTEADRTTPIRCKPAPYYVAERAERPSIERILVTGTRVPMTIRDVPDRRTRPCFLMRDVRPQADPPRTAD